jgi:hypothetical protein
LLLRCALSSNPLLLGPLLCCQLICLHAGLRLLLCLLLHSLLLRLRLLLCLRLRKNLALGFGLALGFSQPCLFGFALRSNPIGFCLTRLPAFQLASGLASELFVAFCWGRVICT